MLGLDVKLVALVLGVWASFVIFGIAQEGLTRTKFGADGDSEGEQFKFTTFLVLLQSVGNSLVAAVLLILSYVQTARCAPLRRPPQPSAARPLPLPAAAAPADLHRRCALQIRHEDVVQRRRRTEGVADRRPRVPRRAQVWPVVAPLHPLPAAGPRQVLQDHPWCALTPPASELQSPWSCQPLSALCLCSLSLLFSPGGALTCAVMIGEIVIAGSRPTASKVMSVIVLTAGIGLFMLFKPAKKADSGKHASVHPPLPPSSTTESAPIGSAR